QDHNDNYRCGFGSIDHIFWCNWLFFTSGPNWLLGGKNCNSSLELASITFSNILKHKIGYNSITVEQPDSSMYICSN
ncbi:hypothetical protein MIMGU_mgv11b019547mg, partial [Erythranthe guttata]